MTVGTGPPPGCDKGEHIQSYRCDARRLRRAASSKVSVRRGSRRREALLALGSPDARALRHGAPTQTGSQPAAPAFAKSSFGRALASSLVEEEQAQPVGSFR